MRTEREMMGLILGTAREDERVRAVYMNGSRTNPAAPGDKYRDYDIVYVVKETETFIQQGGCAEKFGEAAVVQEPYLNDVRSGGGTADFSRRYTWLMLFKDGNRIDLSIETREEALRNVGTDSLTKILLDKDGFLPELPSPTDADYRVKRPGEGEYWACCNEFWWCLNNVAKGIARQELPYAMEMFHRYVREALNRMTEWDIGIRTDFGVSPGKMGKYFKRYLPGELYGRYAATYSDADYGRFWESVFCACGLFGTLAREVGEALGYVYRKEEEQNMLAYLRGVREDCREVGLQ